MFDIPHLYKKFRESVGRGELKLRYYWHYESDRLHVPAYVHAAQDMILFVESRASALMSVFASVAGDGGYASPRTTTPTSRVSNRRGRFYLQVAVSPEMPILLANPMNQALLVSWLRCQANRSIFTETD